MPIASAACCIAAIPEVEPVLRLRTRVSWPRWPHLGRLLRLHGRVEPIEQPIERVVFRRDPVRQKKVDDKQRNHNERRPPPPGLRDRTAKRPRQRLTVCERGRDIPRDNHEHDQQPAVPSLHAPTTWSSSRYVTRAA